MEKVTFNSEGIRSVLDVQAFFKALFTQYKIDFHPDLPASSYVDRAGDRVFILDDADLIDSCLEKCFQVCDLEVADIYDISLEQMKEVYGIESIMAQ